MKRSMKRTYSSLVVSFTKKLILFLLVLSFLFVIGHLLANHLNDAHSVVQIPEKNNPLFILWRVFIYSIAILLLTPAAITKLGKIIYFPKRVNHKKLQHYRKITIISMVIYELVIVQNLFKVVIQWGYYYVSG